MEWGAQQNAAIDAVHKWHSKGTEPLFRLFGYAGTGKTTLARHLADQSNGRVLFAAYTGKAAQVLTTKGCPASTLHQLIYRPKPKSKVLLTEMEAERERLWNALGDLSREVKALRPEIVKIDKDIKLEIENLKRKSFTLNTESELRGADLLIVDECSMVGKQMAEDLLHFETPILVLGDPAQLPPVKNEGYFTDAPADVMLTEIHRQARGNPIIELATMVRNGKKLPVGMYGDSQVHSPGTNLKEVVMASDQVLCGKNKTRHGSNKKIRSYLGRTSELPQVGDRMVCLNNNHNEGLLNGQIWIATSDSQYVDDTKYTLDAYNEDHENQHQSMVVWKDEPPWYEADKAEQFDFGYALTCHKAQGSQWGHVVVLDEGAVFRQHADKWRYTAITRASEKLDIMKL